jgi:hypothetical protein
VGVTLKITPQINQENVVRLEVFVEVIKIKNAAVALATNTPTTFKRTAQTTVIVQDGNTLVMGGIIGDDVQDTSNKVPFLGDIPAEARAVTKEKRDHANYHHETGWEDETFKYKENTREVLKSRHIPSTVKEEDQKEEEPGSIEDLKN